MEIFIETYKCMFIFYSLFSYHKWKLNLKSLHLFCSWFSNVLKVGCPEVCWELSVLVCDHIRSLDEQMPSQLLEVSLALSEGSLQWHVLLLRVNPPAIQCQPETNRTKIRTSFLCPLLSELWRETLLMILNSMP